MDLDGVGRVDSSGIGELGLAYNRVAAYGGRLYLLNAPEKVTDLFRLAGLASILGLRPSGEPSDAAAKPTPGGLRLIWS